MATYRVKGKGHWQEGKLILSGETVEIEGDYNVRGNIKTVVRASYTRPD